MFGKIKKILGIEGVKIQLDIPETVREKEGVIEGKVILTSLRDDSVVEAVKITVIEKYSRGRRKSKLIDEYELGKTVLTQKIKMSKNDIIEIPFDVEFSINKSEMDRAEDNLLLTGFVKVAKLLKGVKSTYKVQAEAIEEGAKLHPLDVRPIVIRG